MGSSHQSYRPENKEEFFFCYEEYFLNQVNRLNVKINVFPPQFSLYSKTLKRIWAHKIFVESNKILIVHQLNIFKNVIFMHKVERKSALNTFPPKFHEPTHA